MISLSKNNLADSRIVEEKGSSDSDPLLVNQRQISLC